MLLVAGAFAGAGFGVGVAFGVGLGVGVMALVASSPDVVEAGGICAKAGRVMRTQNTEAAQTA